MGEIAVITRGGMSMQAVFEAINGVFGFIGPLSDLLWDFPTNFEWYRNIPILGNISLAIIVLLGSGIFFTIKLGFIQVTHFKKGILRPFFDVHLSDQDAIIGSVNASKILPNAVIPPMIVKIPRTTSPCGINTVCP